MPSCRLLLALILLFAAIPRVQAQEPSPAMDSLLLKLARYNKSSPQEKIHIHFNRSRYGHEDTVYFKLYLLDPVKGEPSLISKTVHVDVFDDKDQSLQRLLLAVGDGIAFGSFPVNSAAPFIRVVAYTNWMRNFPASGFADISLPLGVDASIPNAVNAGSVRRARVGQFPEGGRLLEGIPSRLGFQVTDSGGASLACQVQLTGNNDRVLGTVQTGYTGAGHFDFTPQPGEKYFIQISDANGAENRFPVEGIAEKGYGLQVRWTEDGKLRVGVNAVLPEKQTPYLLVARSNNKILYAAQGVTGEKSVSALLSPRRFPSGMVAFTVFDEALQPVADRKIFIRHSDQLQVKLENASPDLRAGEQIRLNLETRDSTGEPALASFSVSVEQDAPDASPLQTAPDIFSDLLLVQPAHPLHLPEALTTDSSSAARALLDDLVLTMQPETNPWEDILAGRTDSLHFLPEEPLFIKGRATDAAGKALAGIPVFLVSIQGTAMALDTVTDAEGRFRFGPLQFTDSLVFQLQGAPQSGKSVVKFVLDSLPAFTPPSNKNLPFMQYVLRSASAAAKQAGGSGREETVTAKNATVLKKVTVTARKNSIRDEAVAPSMNLNGPGNADQVVTYEDLKNCHDISICLQGMLRGVYFRNMLYPPGDRNAIPIMMAYSSASAAARPMLIIRDGVELPLTQTGSDIRNLNPYDIQSIEVLRSGNYTHVYGPRGAYGVLVITSKQSNIDFDADSRKKMETYRKENTFTGTATGFAISVPFQPSSQRVFWDPNIVTDDEGKAQFEFRLPTRKGKIKLTIEGISDDGRLARQVFYYDVK